MNMKIIISILLLLGSACVHADLYKWKDVEDNTHYTDRRPMEASKVEVIPEKKLKNASTEQSNVSGPYERFVIASPENNGIVRSNEENVDISIEVNPALEEQHFIQIYLDGQKAGEKMKNTQLTLNQLARGSHRLKAEIVDENNVTVMTATSISFQFRKEVDMSKVAPRL